MKFLKQMKKDHINLIKFLVIFILLLQNSAYADNFLLPDWNYSSFPKKTTITEDADRIIFKQVRENQNFNNFFDEQIITIYKKSNEISPQEAGQSYLAVVLFCDKTCEKYILENSSKAFEAVFCSPKLQRCEIIRYYNGYKGLVEIKYIHNNIWHFQNNIGSFIEFQRRIYSHPVNLLYKSISDKTEIRL